jgi:hypothetical protein
MTNKMIKVDTIKRTRQAQVLAEVLVKKEAAVSVVEWRA